MKDDKEKAPFTK